MFHVKFTTAVVVAVVAALLAAGPAAASGWTVVSVPQAGQSMTLSGVSADSGSDAWAVGQTRASGTQTAPVAYRWNGTSWQQVAVPHTQIATYLAQVSAASPTDAWAVGEKGNQAQYRHPLAFHWDGTAWTQTPADGTTAANDFRGAQGVADIGPANAYAVGTFLEHWDGTSWTELAYPDPANPDTLTTSAAMLTAISAEAANDIWVVGDYQKPDDGTCGCAQTETFSLHWDGASWDEIPMPSDADTTFLYHLSSIEAISPSDVWAVGNTSGDLGDNGTLIEHWDGTSWSVVPAPSPGAGQYAYPVLTAVTSTSPSNVFAVGDTGSGSSLIEHWDGNSWTTVSSPDEGKLNSVSTTSGAAITWAIGNNIALENG